jgi:hypothetical protein
MSNPNEERERLADEAMGKDPDRRGDGGEPWAKTSSGDADTLADEDDDDDGDDEG